MKLVRSLSRIVCVIFVDFILLAAQCSVEWGGDEPKSAEDYNDRGAAYSNEGKLDLAIADFTKAIELRPNFDLAYYNRGLTYFAKGDYGLAIADYNRAIELRPFYGEAYANRGNTYGQMGEHVRAIADATKAIELLPNLFIPYYNRGIAYNNTGEHDRAIADFSKVIELAPDNPRRASGYYKRASSYSQNQVAGTIVEDLKLAVQLHPDFGDGVKSDPELAWARSNLPEILSLPGMKPQ